MIDNKINMKLGYAILSAIALVLFAVYLVLFKKNRKKETTIAFLAVLLINVGYFLLASATSLEMALFGNRLTYGSVITLMTSMLLVGFEISGLKMPKKALIPIIVIDALLFLLCASGGTSISLYYSSVSLGNINGSSCLIKEYGPLHSLFLIYVLINFVVLVAFAVYVLKKKLIKDSTNPILLTIIVFINVFVWLLEKLSDSRFELLAISYCVTELLLLVMLKNKETYEKLALEKEKSNEPAKTVEEIVACWSRDYNLTERETEVLKLLINNVPRNEVAQILFISEHTVKKHTTHIYEKLCVTSRNDLLFKLNEEISK